MNKTVKKRWVNNLRSGKYEQGSGCLRDCEDKNFNQIADWIEANL